MEFPKQFFCECAERSTYQTHIPAPLFRKSFFLAEENAAGTLVIAGLGFYELFVNGRKITKGWLAPYISNPDHIVYYDKYSISEYLQKGENVIGVMLGDGFLNSKTGVWDFAGNVFNAAPKLALSAVITQNGETQTFTAADFRCAKGPVLFNDLRSGVFYDARQEPRGWAAPGFAEDARWHAPLAARPPRGQARLCRAEPIRMEKALAPVRVMPGSLAPYTPRADVQEGDAKHGTQEPPPDRQGGYLYDFGENNAGIFRLRIRGKPGQRIDIQCAEQLLDGAADYNNINFYPDGYAQRDLYIAGSEEEEIFEPPFTYHGFRYLYISGIEPEQATPELLTFLVLHSDLEERGGFACSDTVSNTICEMAQRSDRANFFYFPTDCPHREKNGWTGDAQVSAEHMILTLGAENSWREWLHSVRRAQTAAGQLPGIVPTGTWGYEWGSGPAWDRVLFELPAMVLQYRGETEIIRENAHAMLRYLEYISRKRDARGIVAVGLGDWSPVDRATRAYQAPLGFTDSVMVYQMCRDAQRMFEAVHLPLHAAFARQLGGEMRAAVRAEYLDLSAMLVKSDCQTAQAMAIYYDIFDPAEKPAAFRQLLRILQRDAYKITCGFLGLRVLYHVLAQNGAAELAYRMITGPEYPSYGYLARRGDTTLPEQFLPDAQRRLVSQNHHFLGDVLHWYMRWPGGLHIIDHRTVEVRPCFLSALKHAEAWHRLPDGEVRVSWRRQDEQIVLKIICPAAVRCTLRLDGAYALAESGDRFAEHGAGHWRICHSGAEVDADEGSGGAPGPAAK